MISFVLVESVLSCLAALRVFFQTRSDTALEILALRQQLAVLKRKRPRPQLNRLDRIFWIALRGCWPGTTGHSLKAGPDVHAEAWTTHGIRVDVCRQTGLDFSPRRRTKFTRVYICREGLEWLAYFPTR